MKKSLLVLAAIALAAGLFVSCTPPVGGTASAADGTALAQPVPMGAAMSPAVIYSYDITVGGNPGQILNPTINAFDTNFRTDDLYNRTYCESLPDGAKIVSLNVSAQFNNTVPTGSNLQVDLVCYKYGDTANPLKVINLFNDSDKRLTGSFSGVELAINGALPAQAVFVLRFKLLHRTTSNTPNISPNYIHIIVNYDGTGVEPIPHPAPTNLKLAAQRHGIYRDLVLNWTRSNSNRVKSYSIYLNGRKIDAVSSSSAAWGSHRVYPDQHDTHKFYVTAVFIDNGESEPSNTVSYKR